MWKKNGRGAANLRERRGLMDALDGTSLLFWANLNGTIRDANGLACEATGLSVETLMTRNFCDMMQESALASAQQITECWQDACGGKASWISVILPSPKGELHVRLLLLPIRDKGNQIREMMITGHDFTDEHLATQKKLSEAKKLHENHAIIEFDRDGKVKAANHGFLAAMGYTLSDIVGKHHRKFMFAEDAAHPDYEQFWSDLRQGISQPGLVRRKRSNGTEIWLEAIYSPILDAAGEPIGVIKGASDVSARIGGLKDVTNALSHVADGDLSVRLHNTMPPELEGLRTAYNGTLDRLGELVGDITGVSSRVEHMVTDARAQAGDLASRVESQAAAVQQSSSMMENLSGLVQQNAAEAETASQTTTAMSKRARAGAEVSQEAAEAMQQIEAGSKGISEIISIIDSIAFQTNLLALNAAVEAARAGEAGRGFSVVAAEVRVLAQRSADAAKDVAQMIRSSTSHVQNGVTLVERTGVELSDIEVQISAISEAVDRIATSSREQATSLSEITMGVSKIDSTTAQTYKIADKTLATANTLHSEATEMARLVEVFRNSDSAQRGTTLRAAS